MEIIPGVHQLKVLEDSRNPSRYLNTYLLLSGKECVLIDTGWNTPDALASLEKQLQTAGVQLGDITTIIVTHIHPDHYSLVPVIKRKSRADLVFHHLGRAILQSTLVNVAEHLQTARQLLLEHGVPEEKSKPLAEAFPSAFQLEDTVLPDKVILGGEALAFGSFELEPIWTPGHSIEHVCLYDRAKGLVFSGDHLLPVPAFTPMLAFDRWSGPDPVRVYVGSLRHIGHLPVKLVLPGHGSVFADLQPKIEGTIRFVEEKAGLLLSAMADAPQTAYWIARQPRWQFQGRDWERLDPLHQYVAIQETIAYLEFQRLDGRVHRFVRDQVYHYVRV